MTTDLGIYRDAVSTANALIIMEKGNLIEKQQICLGANSAASRSKFLHFKSVLTILALCLCIGGKVFAANGDNHVLFDVTTASYWEVSVQNYDATAWTSNGCVFSRANNNQKGWAYVGIGGRNITNEIGYIGTIVATTYNTAELKYTIAKARDDDHLTINSITLKVYSGYNSSTKEYSTQVDEVSFTVSTYTSLSDNSVITFTPSGSYGSTCWASGVYFKLEFDMTNTHKKNNKFQNHRTQISKIVAVEGCTGGGGSSPCRPEFSEDSDYIVNFTLGSIINNSTGFSTGGYGDYTNLSTSLTQGSTPTATLTSSSGSGTHAAAVWIDFDDDGTFSVSERVGTLDDINESSTVNINLSIPVDAATGSHTMRVVYQYDVDATSIDPCVSDSYGEVEDYTVVIVAPVSYSYRITYDANGGTGTMSAQSGTGSYVTLNTCTFTRANYSFRCWNTLADGTGTNYSDGQTIALSGNLTPTLYAQWLADDGCPSITFSEQGYSDQEVVLSATFGNSPAVNVIFDQGTNGSNAPKYFNNGTAIRAYGGNTITIYVNGFNAITSVRFTFGSGDGSNAITASSGTYDSGRGLWTGTESSVTFTIGGTSGNRRIAGLKVCSESSSCVTEAFEEYAVDELPVGWRSYNSNGSSVPSVSNYSDYYIGNYVGNYMLLLSTETTEYSYAILPLYSGISSAKFYYRYESTSYGDFTVGYVTNNSGYATYQVLGTPSRTTSWTEYSLLPADITTINSNNGYIAFRFEGGGYYEYGVAIDNVEVCQSCTLRPSMTFSQSVVNYTIGSGAFTKPTLTNGTGAEFTSSNTAVATVNPSTGDVTIVGIGTTLIAATIPASDGYCTSVASYTINVSANCTSTITMVNGDDIVQALTCGNYYCFYDTGGESGGYGSNESATATFTANGDITIVFNAFETESDYDMLTIYDGTESEGTILLDGHGGSSLPPSVTANSGTMTVVWESDYSNNFSGWNAVVSASGCCTPRTGTFAFSPATANALVSTGSTFTEPTLTNELVPAIATVEYSTSNPAVATVDEYGQVTIVGIEGEATIYARTPKTGGYCASEASYTITVTDGCARVGDGSVVSGSYSPLYAYYKKSYSQMIYTGAEIGGEGTIGSIAFNSTLTGSYVHTINIYMGMVDKTSFSSSSDFVPVSQLTPVYSGSWTPTEGWNSFDITDFDYNDVTKNLVVAMYSTASDYESSSMHFYSTTTTSNQVVYAYDDSDDPNPSTNDGAWGSYDGYKGVTTTRANIKLCMNTCTQLSGDFSFSQSECEATIGHSFTKPTLNNGTGRTPTYSSSNTDVATVDASGNVTIGTQEGVTTIMAVIPASGEYCSKVASYTITVSDGCLRIGEGSGTTGSAPLYGYYKYSYDQMIYTASEIGGAGTINSIAFKSVSTNSVARNVKIYMGMTTKTSFASATDFVPVSELTLVYDGSMYGTWSITEGWNQFDIDGGFEYDDADKNIVVAVYAYASTYSTSSFYSTEVSGKTIYASNDTYDPNPSTNDGAWSSYNGNTGSSNSRPSIKFCIDRCTTPTFAYSAGSYSYTMGNTWNPPTLSNNSGSTPIYTSSDENVATIAADGTVTPVGSGTTIIKAEMDIFGIYCSAVSSYTLTISCSERPAGQLSFASAAMEASLSGGAQASPALTNTTGLTVTYESSNTSVATVESDGTVTPVSDGVAIITASVPASGIYCAKEVSYTLTVTCTEPVITFPDDGTYNESTHTITYIQGNGIKYPEIKYNGEVLPSETSGTSSNTTIATTSSGIVRVNTTHVGSTSMVLDVPSNGEYCSVHLEFTIEVTCTAPVIAFSSDYNAGTSTFNIAQGATLGSSLITCDGSNVLPAGTTCTTTNSSVAQLSGGRIFTIDASEAGTAHVELNIPASEGKCAYNTEFDVVITCTDATIEYSLEYVYEQQLNAAEFALPASAAGILYNGGALPSGTTGTSTNTMIADVRGGQVLVNKGGVGTAEVTLDIPADGNYCATSISFTVTVKYDCTNSNKIGSRTTGNDSKYAPIYTQNAQYSYSQQLYTANEVRAALNGGATGLGDGACLISTIYFEYGGTAMTTDVSVYMANISGTNNLNGGAWLTGLTKIVSNKSIIFSSGWVEIELERPFAWDGTSNLLVAVQNTTLSSNGGYFYKTSTSSNYMTLYCAGSYSIEMKNKVPWYYNDADHTDCYATKTYYRPDIKFCGVPQYTLTYDDGTTCTGSVSNMPDNQVGRGRIRLQTESPSCSGSGMSFIEWNTNASGTGDRYMPGDVFNLTSNTTLYAIFKNCSGIASSSITVPAGQYDGGIPYYTVCYGNSVQLTGASNVTGIREWKWQINTHNGEDLIILSGNPCTYTPAEVIGNDVTLLVIRDSDGCASMATGRIKVSDGVTPSPASYNVSDPICVGLDENIIIGSGAEATVRVDPKPIRITARLGQGKKTFIPDGPNCIDECYTSSVTFHDFSSGATVTSADNINFLRINLEHSFIIDMQIKITCPNGQSAIVLEDWYRSSDGGYDDFGSGDEDYEWPYRSSRLQSLGFGTPDRANDGEDVCDASDNPSGTGADYCWSNKTSINGNTVGYASGSHSYVYERGTDGVNHTSGTSGVTAYKLVKPSDPDGLRNFYKPRENFYSKLADCPLNGTWTLSVCDVFGEDNGYVFNWELSLDETLIPDPWTYTIEAAGNSIEDRPSFVALSSSNMDIAPTTIENVGNYTSNLVITDNFGCDASAVPITYSVYDAVNANIVQPGMVCVGSETTINAYPMGGSFHYVWGDGLHVDQRTFTTTILANASYDVTVTNPDGCKSNAHSDVNIKYPLTGSGDGDFIWSGLSTDWNADNNWFKLENFNEGRYVLQSGTGRESPTTNSNVFVTKYYDCVSEPTLNVNGDAYAKDLTIGDGITLMGGSNTLRIAGDFELDGTADFVPESGTVRFVGSGDQTVEKSDAIAFNNVLFDQSGENINTISIDNGMTVNGAATFTKGIVDGDATFEDGSSVTNTIAQMTRASYVDGLVTKKGDGTFTFPTGNDGVLGAFTSTIASNTDDGMTVRFNHKRDEGASGTEQSGFSLSEYPRWWNINDMCNENNPQFDHVSNFEYWRLGGASTSLSNLTLKVDADAQTEHFHNPSEYEASKIYAAAHYNCWKNIGGSASVSVDHKTITVSDIAMLSRTRAADFDGIITLGSTDHNTVLPIELTALTATCDGRRALVEWTTATERNNDYFVIERSDNAIEFYEVARIAGAGNSIEPLSYSYIDYGVRGGDNYYRLVQVDYDGTRTASEIIVANCIEASGEPEVLASPNPFSGDLTVELDNFGDRPARIDVYDMLGRLVYTEEVGAPQNNYQTVLHFGNLPDATYTVRVGTADFVINRKVVKNQ